MSGNAQWPDLPLAEWADTCDTLHLWTQIAGKVILKLAWDRAALERPLKATRAV